LTLRCYDDDDEDEDVGITIEDCKLLKRMLQRRKVGRLKLKRQDSGLGADEWRLLAEGIADSAHVNTGTLGEGSESVQPGTLLPLLRGASIVNRLAVCAAGSTAVAL
jgi:hypothetical protein